MNLFRVLVDSGDDIIERHRAAFAKAISVLGISRLTFDLGVRYPFIVTVIPAEACLHCYDIAYGAGSFNYRSVLARQSLPSQVVFRAANLANESGYLFHYARYITKRLETLQALFSAILRAPGYPQGVASVES